MSTSNLTGFSPKSPTRYLGPNVAIPIIVTVPREPTSADIKQPSTGKYYSFGTFWIVGKDPTTGEYGDLWYLSKIENNLAFWEQILETSSPLLTLTGDNGGAIDPTSDNWNILGQENGTIPVMQTNGNAGTSTLYIEDRTSTTAFVVDPSDTAGQRGTYQTIEDAISAATAGTVIFIKAGTYTEDITLKDGVDLASYGNSGLTPSVTIVGKITHENGRVTISGIGLQTNGDFSISLEGSSNNVALHLVECNVICQDFCAISMTNTGTGSSLRLINCWGRTNTNATNFFQCTGTASLTFWNVNILDGGSSLAQTIPSTFASSGQLLVKYSIIRFPISLTGNSRISATDSEFNTFITNTTPLNIQSTASGAALGSYIRGCILMGGNEVALTVNNIPDPPNPDIPVTLNMMNCNVITTASIPITGTGTIRQCGTCYISSNPIPPSTTLTITRQPFDAGALYGNWNGAAPAAGYVGEYISSFIPVNAMAPDPTPVALTTDVTVNVTSITLTPGVWDVSGIVMFKGLGTAATRQNAGVGTGSAVLTIDSYGNNTVSATFDNTTADDVGLTIPSFRELVPVSGGNVTMYLKARAEFSTGASSPVAYGRISATRVC